MAEYLDYLKNQAKQNGAAGAAQHPGNVRASLLASAGLSPDMVAKAREVGLELGRPDTLVLAAPDIAEMELTAQRIESFPAVAKWAAQSPVNAAMAKEEPEELGGIFDILEASIQAESKGAWNELKGVAGGVASIAPKAVGNLSKFGWDVNSALWGLGEAYTRFTGWGNAEKWFRGQRLTTQEYSKTTGRFLADDRWNLSKDLSGDILENPEILLHPQYYAYQGGDAVASMLPALLAAYATGGSSLAGAAVGGLQEGTALYTDLMNEGKSSNEAALGAAAEMTAGSIFLNKIPLDEIFKALPLGFRKKILDIGQTAFWEGATEWAENPMQALLSGLARGDDAATITDGVLKAAKDLNVIPGALLAGGGARTMNIMMESRAAQSFVDQQIAINEKVTASQLYKRSPEKMRELLDSAGPVMSQVVTLPRAQLSPEVLAALNIDEGASDQSISVPLSELHARLTPEAFSEIIPLAAPVDAESLVTVRRKFEKTLAKSIGQAVQARDAERAVTATVGLEESRRATEDLRAKLRAGDIEENSIAYAEAQAVETFFQTELSDMDELEAPGAKTKMLGRLGVAPDVYDEALAGGGELEFYLNGARDVKDDPLWDRLIDVLEAQPVEITREMQADLESLPPLPSPLDQAGADVTTETRAELVTRLTAAGRSAGQANRETELLSRLASTLSRITGQDPNKIVLNTFRFGLESRGGAASYNQAAMYRAQSETIEEFIEEAKQSDPNEGKPFFHFNNIFGDSVVELGADQVRHIADEHPGFNDWVRIPEVIERGQAVSAGPNRVTGTEAFIYTLEDNGSTLVVVAAPNIGGGKRRKISRTMVLTAFRDTTAAVNYWVANNKAASSPSAGALQLNPRLNEATPSGPESGNLNISKIGNAVNALKKSTTFEQSAPRGRGGAVSYHQNAQQGNVRAILEGAPVTSVKAEDIPIQDGKIISTALSWIESNPQSPAKTAIGDIEITRRGIRDSFGHVAFPDKLTALPAIKTVLENGAYLGSGTDFDSKNIDNYYFAAPVTIDGIDKIVFVRTRKKAGGTNKFYVHDVFLLDDIKKPGTSKTTDLAQEAPNKGNVPDFYKSIIRKALEVNDSFEQAGPRGRIEFLDDATINIIFTKSQDASTAVHEFAHAFREMAARTLAIPEEQIDDRTAYDAFKEGWREVEIWLSRFDDEATLVAEYDKYQKNNYGWRAYGDLNAEEKASVKNTAKHEYFARGFEKYLMEGAAPTRGLRKIFGQMKRFLTAAYKTVRGNLDVELNDEVRSFFDSILATDEEMALDAWRSDPAIPVDEMEQLREIDPVAVAEYEAAAEKGRQAVEAQILALRVKEKHKAMKQWRKDGRRFAKEDQRIQRIQEIKRQGGIDPDSLETLGYDAVAMRQFIKRFPGLIKSSSKIGLDYYNEQFGFETADDLWNALLETPTIAQIQSQYVEEQAAEWEKYFEADAGVTDAELDAWEREKNLWAKFMGAKGSKYAPRPAKGLKAFIESQFSGLTVDEIERGNAEDLKASLKAQARAATEGYTAGEEAGRTAGLMAGVREGTVRGRYEERQRAKAELARAKAEGRANLNWKLAEERARALEARQELAIKYQLQSQIKKEMAQFEAQAKRLLKQGERGFFENRGIDQEYLEQVHGILGMFGLGEGAQDSAPALATFIAEAQTRGESPVVAEWIINGNVPQWQNGQWAGKPKSWKALTYDQFRDLADAVNNLAFLGRARRVMTVDGRQWNIDNLAQALDKNIRQNVTVDEAKTAGQLIRGQAKEQMPHKRALKGVKDAAVTLIKVESMAHVLDGGQLDGLTSKAIYAPIRNAWETGSKLTEMVAQVLDKIAGNTIGEKALRKMSGHKVNDPRLPKYLQGITREQLLVLVMNSGNAGNKAALFGTDMDERGTRLDEQALLAARDILTDGELAYIQQVWDFLNNTMYPQLNELQKRSSGVELKKEAAEAFTVRGVTYVGGYFPLSFDPRIGISAAAIAERQANKDLMRGNTVRPSVRASATRERTGKTYENLFPLLNLGVLSNSLRDNIRDLAYREALRDVQKLINKPLVRQAITGGLGEEFYNEIPLWLQDIADRQGNNSGALTLVKKIKNNLSLASMGIKMSVVFAQISGFTQSVQMLGAKYFLRGVKNMYGHPGNMKAAWKFVMDNSYEIRKRNSTSYDLDISESLSAKSMFYKNVREKYGEAVMKPVALMNQLLVNAVWQGAYIRGREEGRNHEAAVYYADALVRTTQPTGRDIDRSRAMRGDVYGLFGAGRGREIGKLVTMFGTFFSGTVNTGWETAMGVKGDIRRKKYGKASAAAVFGFVNLVVFPALVEALIKGGVPTDEDEFDEYVGDVGKGAASLAVAGFPIVRDLVGFATGAAYRYQVSPIFTPIENAMKYAGQAASGDLDISKYGTRTQLINIAGAATGLPSGQINVTRKGLEDWDKNDGLDKIYRLFVRDPEGNK